MAKKAQRYNIKKLPFPIRPGDRVYFVLDDGRIESDIATAVAGFCAPVIQDHI